MIYKAIVIVCLSLYASAAHAEEFTKAKIKKIDLEKQRIILIHEELKSLDMPAMTMVFHAEKSILEPLQEGQEIEAVLERIDGKLTMTKVKE